MFESIVVDSPNDLIVSLSVGVITCHNVKFNPDVYYVCNNKQLWTISYWKKENTI